MSVKLVVSFRISRSHRIDVSKQPSLAFFNSETKPGRRLGVTLSEKLAQLRLEFTPAFIIQITNDNYCRRVIEAVARKSLSVSPQKFCQILEENAIGRFVCVLHVSGNAPDTFVGVDLKCVRVSEKLGEEVPEHSFA